MSTILGIPDATMDIPKPTTGKLIVVTPSNPTSSVILPQSFYIEYQHRIDFSYIIDVCNSVSINSNGHEFDYDEISK